MEAEKSKALEVRPTALPSSKGAPKRKSSVIAEIPPTNKLTKTTSSKCSKQKKAVQSSKNFSFNDLFSKSPVPSTTATVEHTNKPAASDLALSMMPKREESTKPSKRYSVWWSFPEWCPINHPITNSPLDPVIEVANPVITTSDIYLGYTDDEIEEIANNSRVALRSDQVRAINLWMKQNRVRSMKKAAGTFDDLLATLSFLKPHYSDAVRCNLRIKTRKKAIKEGIRMEKSGAIIVWDKDLPEESICYADWTQSWMAPDWDGSLEKPDSWDSEVDHRRALIEDSFCRSEEADDINLFVVEEQTQHVDSHDIEQRILSLGIQALPNLLVESDPRTVNIGRETIDINNGYAIADHRRLEEH